MQIRQKNRLLIVGDYDLSLGQGLLIYNGFGFGKAIHSTFRSSPTFKAHTSSREYRFNRGVALKQKFGRFDFYSWLSRLKVDGKIKIIDNEKLVSLYNTGIHLSDSELESKKSTLHNSAGFKLKYSSKN